MADELWTRHAQELHEMWQAKVLAEAKGLSMLAVMSMLAHAYPDGIEVLVRLVKPLCWDVSRNSLRTPFLSSIARIDKWGRVVADKVMTDPYLGERNARNQPVFNNIIEFQNEMRRVADRAKLSDADREQFFIVAKNWVGADQRLDPTMDPKDPDAKRLVAN